MRNSLVAGVYEKVIDRESAYERLTAAHQGATPAAPGVSEKKPGFLDNLFGGGSPPGTSRAARGRKPDSIVEVMAKSAVRSIGSTMGREIIRGIMGSVFGGTRKR